MFDSNIALTTLNPDGSVNETTLYSTNTIRGTSTIRSDASAALESPKDFTISHDVAKSGRVNSAVILQDNEINTDGINSDVRITVKYSYNPKVKSPADLQLRIEKLNDQLLGFALNKANLDKLLNREH